MISGVQLRESIAHLRYQKVLHCSLIINLKTSRKIEQILSGHNNEYNILTLLFDCLNLFTLRKRFFRVIDSKSLWVKYYRDE